MVNFEEYLISKKIDSVAFQRAQPKLWNEWFMEFEQMHPNSFTVQKLNLINPIRRQYPLKLVPEKPPTSTEEVKTEPKPIVASPSSKPVVPRPVFKPKPKMQ